MRLHSLAFVAAVTARFLPAPRWRREPERLDKPISIGIRAAGNICPDLNEIYFD
ncbi:hypothetical protein [Stappia stellulata]|uniref:hypothetical protein n=1 Tax=Stappia stellulata TaxID=71235 RepID=UPI00040BCBD5|nr:hypothetical protein [Stappia stellulata]